MGIQENRKLIRKALRSRKTKAVSDPPRFPKVSNKFEGLFKKNFSKTTKSIMTSVTKEMVEIVKNR